MALWVAAAFVIPAGAQPPGVSVTSVRYWSLQGVTRVAIEVSGEVKYRFEKLGNPDRLFIDLSGARLKLGEKAFHVVKIGDKLVKQVRVAQKDASVTRVVLDLEVPVEQEISQLANPNRIMIEVRVAASKSEKTEVSSSRTGVEKIDGPAPASAPAAVPPPPEPVKTDETAKPAEPDATPKAARPTAAGGRTLTRALGLKIGRVVLDPGHGGNDHGATGPAGLVEKELVLDIALRLGALIEQRLGSEIIYTRSTDVYVPLEQRTALANEKRADLFLSIHANYSSIRSISGAEVYYLNFTTNKDALDVAARENAGSGKSVFELRELIQKIALRDKLDESREFASRVQSSLASTWSKMNPTAGNRGVKKNIFVVLIGAAMPSVLAEIGFISNPRDEVMLTKPDQRQRIAEALFKGVDQYASSLSQARVAQGGQ